LKKKSHTYGDLEDEMNKTATVKKKSFLNNVPALTEPKIRNNSYLEGIIYICTYVYLCICIYLSVYKRIHLQTHVYTMG
jgi:hypothetical protein